MYNNTPLTIQGVIAGKPTQLLIDSGASLTLINLQFFLQLSRYYRQQARPPPPNLCLQLADRSQLQVKYTLSLPITIANSTRTHTVYVVPRLWRSCIIGNDLIRDHNLQIDGGRQRAYFKAEERSAQLRQERKEKSNYDDEYILMANERIKIPSFHAFNIEVKPDKPFLNEEDKENEYEITSIKQTPCIANGIITPRKHMTLQVANLTEGAIIIYKNQPLATMVRLNQTQINTIQHGITPPTAKPRPDKADIELDLTNTDLNEEQQNKIKRLMQKFPDVFNEKSGRTKKVQHKIDLTPGSKPFNSPPFRYAPARKETIEQHIKEMLEQGIISPSTSPWASPVILVPKKDGSLRFCVDYRKLNSATIRDAYPLPRIDDTLDSLQQAKFVSTLDLRSGYWQVEMDKESRKKTAFVTHKGLFEFNVMPFGLTNAPATFQRLMDMVLAGLKWQCCLVYIDDVVVFSPTFEQHLKDLEKVFEALKIANLTLKSSKCQFCRREMRYLGHTITRDGIKPDPNLIKAVTDFPQPKKIKDVQSFLGLTGYYRRFIKDYSKIAEPLTQQLRSSQKGNHHLQWSKECTDAFETLKEKLTKAPIMNTPNFNQPFILEIDACEYGLGAVLIQEYEEKKYVIAYASRTLSTAERKYGATEREALAIVWATKHFRPYLEGNKIYIRSDCKALEWMRTAKDVTGRLARWAMKLSAYQIEEIKYRPGKLNANADSLSRNPLPNDDTNQHEVLTMETAINLWQNTNMLNDIGKEQEKDTKLKPIIEFLKAQPTAEFNGKRNPYILINGLLYKIKNSKKHYNQRLLGKKHLLVIPRVMQNKLLDWAHNHPTAGHGGQQRTLFRLTTRVYWETMRKDIFKYIAACRECQQFKYKNSPTAGPMQMHIVDEPWHTIGIDIMGPFPATARQKRFLLVVVDYFTRWVELFPLKSTTSTDIANILMNEVFSRYGLPKHIVSDNGPQLISNLLKDFCDTLNIKQNLTANYHPQSNMTERVNRTLKPLIAIYAQRHYNSWDTEIQKLAFAIRTAVNETTGETPAFMMFGRDPRGPLDLLVGETIESPNSIEVNHETIQDYKKRLIYNLRSAFTAVREHAEIEKIRQKRKYDQRTSQRQYHEGDLVWVEIPRAQIGENPMGGKLRPQYEGPCRLIKQSSPNTFTVRRLSDNVNLGATNTERVKPYIELEKYNQDEVTSGVIDDHMNNEDMVTKNGEWQKEKDKTSHPRASNRHRKVPRRYLQD